MGFLSKLLGTQNNVPAKKQAYVETGSYATSTVDDPYYRILRDSAMRFIRAAGRPDYKMGYYNLPKWHVKGKKQSTGRINSFSVYAIDPEHAREEGKRQRGLLDPIEVSFEPFKPAPYYSELDISLPNGAVYEDYFDLSLCIDDHDCVPMSFAFYSYLTRRGVAVSRLGNRNLGAYRLFSICDDKEKARLYGYAVDCALHGFEPCDIDMSERRALYDRFAEDASSYSKILTSISKRPGEDFWHPNKKTSAWSFAEEWFLSR